MRARARFTTRTSSNHGPHILPRNHRSHQALPFVRHLEHRSLHRVRSKTSWNKTQCELAAIKNIHMRHPSATDPTLCLQPTSSFADRQERKKEKKKEEEKRDTPPQKDNPSIHVHIGVMACEAKRVCVRVALPLSLSNSMLLSSRSLLIRHPRLKPQDHDTCHKRA